QTRDTGVVEFNVSPHRLNDFGRLSAAVLLPQDIEPVAQIGRELLTADQARFKKVLETLEAIEETVEAVTDGDFHGREVGADDMGHERLGDGTVLDPDGAFLRVRLMRKQVDGTLVPIEHEQRVANERIGFEFLYLAGDKLGTLPALGAPVLNEPAQEG